MPGTNTIGFVGFCQTAAPEVPTVYVVHVPAGATRLVAITQDMNKTTKRKIVGCGM